MRPWKTPILLLATALLVALVGVVPAGAKPSVNGKVCIVNAVGGPDDPFNASAAAGAKKAKAKLHVEVVTLDADTDTEVTENIDSFVAAGDCGLIIGLGFTVGLQLEPFIAASPAQQFSVIDFSFGGLYANTAEVLFRVDQASFLAGYVAAGLSETGKVGVFGGLPIPPVTTFMDGYALGVDWFNAQYGTNIEVLGWDPDLQTGIFAFTFQDPTVGQAIASNLFNQGADTVFPVAGFTSLGALDEATERTAAGDEVRVIGVDYDWSQVVGDPERVILTSVIKDFGVAVFSQITALVDGTWFGGEVYEDLASSGVDIAPFRKLNRIVPGYLKHDLKDLRSGIIDGTIPTTPAVGTLANPVEWIIASHLPDPVAWQTLTDALHEMTDLEFVVRTPVDQRSIVEMMCASPGTSIGTTTFSTYVVAKELCGVDAGLRAMRFGYDRYWGQFLVPRGSSIGSIDDLTDLRWAYPDERSASGYLVPLAMMTLADIEFGDSSSSGGHDGAVLAVYNGEAEFATSFFSPPLTPDGMDSWAEGDPPDIPDGVVGDCAPTLDGLFCDGYEVRDARSRVVEAAPDIIQQVRILGISPAIPNDGVSFGSDVPANVRLLVETALVDMADPGSPFHSAFEDSLADLYGWEDLVPDDDADYDTIRILLEAIGFGIDDLD